MKQCKLFIAILLAMLCLLACAAADKPTVYTSGDYMYILLEDGTAEITQYTGQEEMLTVPDELDGYRVTGIGDVAFRSCKSLTSIKIPDSVTRMEGNPFHDCQKLTTINVSPRHPVLATIDGVLFDKTEKKLICYPCALTASSYAVPNGILSIGDRAFYYCSSLTSITLPNSVTSIGYETFSYCYSLTSITLPDGVTSIGDYAFFNCASLTSITIPDSVTSIGNKVFSKCAPQMTVIVARDSYAEQWCIDNNKKYTFPNANDWLLN